MPPREIGRYPVFVPLAHADGMAVAGIRPMPVAVPRATYTAWVPRAAGFGPAVLYPLQGTVLPFAATREARIAAGDAGLSLLERYADDDAYVEAVRAVAGWMVSERLLLPPDAERTIAAAKEGRLAQLGR